MDDAYEIRRRDVEDRFVRMLPILEERRVHASPSRNFELVVDTYAEPGSDWHYSRGLVRELGTEEFIADIRRSAPKFLFAWVERSDGEFLVCGEDPEGYTVVDVRRGVSVCTPPDGSGFNWLQVYPSPDGQTLAVEGCVWGAPNDLVFYDFSDPRVSPMPEIARFSMPTDVLGWVSATTFKFTRFKMGDREHEAVSWTRAGFYTG